MTEVTIILLYRYIEKPQRIEVTPAKEIPQLIFFGWWKRYLKVYHLIAKSKRGFMAQILEGLITYLLLAIYCHKHYQEKVSIKKVRELRIKIQMKPAISKMIYHLLPLSTQAYIIPKNKNGVLTQLLNRTTLNAPIISYLFLIFLFFDAQFGRKY